MSDLLLKVSSRKLTKASELNALRQEHQVPGVIYGFGKENHNIAVEYNPLVKMIKTAGTSRVITLQLEGKDIEVILKSYQQDPVKDTITHVDFMILDPKKSFITTVPLEFTGSSAAVREQGGKLEIKKQSIKVRCLLADLPAKVEVDLSSLAQIGSDIKVADLPIDKKVKVLDGPTEPVIDVIIPKKEDVSKTAAPTEAAPTEAATPEEKSE